jgi:hypothetical protein
MRILASWLLPVSAAASLTAACGAHVVVDGSGGMNGTGGTSSSASSSATASSTATSSSSSSSSGGGCPPSGPDVEAVCEQEGEVCAVPNACCGGQAVCKGGFWTFEGPFCNMPCEPECGPDGFACAVGKTCVTFLGKITTYRCIDDPCPPQALDCACATPACMTEGMICNNIQDGFKVLCDCVGGCN